MDVKGLCFCACQNYALNIFLTVYFNSKMITSRQEAGQVLLEMIHLLALFQSHTSIEELPHE